MLKAFVLAFLVGIAHAQAPVPPAARVVDQTATLTAEQKASLERMLEAFEKRKGSQISVLMSSTRCAPPSSGSSAASASTTARCS
jgi:uncharacterized protein